MATTIQISPKLQKELSRRKLFDRETYEEVIWGILEDTMELSEETKRDIAQAKEDIREGRTIPFEQIKREFGL
ncbi:hypothetical protein J4419_04340 [Candidatus Woesearchaeota archaeon]|nr:hypothetical protein [Candidatus Woesearchaeota archaeon]